MLTNEQIAMLPSRARDLVKGARFWLSNPRLHHTSPELESILWFAEQLADALLARRRDRATLQEALKYLRLERWSTRYVPVQYCGYCGMRRNDGCKPDCRIDALFREDANEQD